MKGISVIICCYNSILRLPLALDYLSKQKTNSILNCEIIIVDNNSTDGTAETADTVWKTLGCQTRFKIIQECKPGLSYARAAGAKEAQYDIIIFCDDDNLLAENYLQYTFELVSKTKNAGYAIWGGQPVAYFDTDATVPEWFEKEKSNYVIGQQASEAGDICNRGYVWGAGMVILRNVFTQIINKKFPLLLTDRTGAALSSGGDSEICLRALIAGYKLYYDPNLLLKHYIPAERLTLNYNAALKKGFFTSNEILNKYKIFIFFICANNKTRRFYYFFIYMLKYYLNKLHIKRLTAYDLDALKALNNNKKFYDKDFNAMHNLLNTLNSNNP